MNKMKTFRQMTELEWKSGEFQFCPLHYAFEVKHDGRHRVRRVAGDSRVEHVYVDARAASVQSTTVKLMLLASIHQKHEVIIVDVENACLNADTSEKVWTKLVAGFGAISGLELSRLCMV